MKNNHPFYSLARFRRVAILTITIGLSLTCLLTSPTSWMSLTEAAGKVGRMPKEAVAQRQLKMTDGSQHSLVSLRGKVAVLSFFAVWCGHSRDQIPALTKLSEAESSRGLQIVGLAVEDERTTPEKVSDFIKDHQLHYPVGMVSDPVFMEYVDSRVLDVPQTLVYGHDGKLAAHFIGQNAANDEALTAAVKKELDKQ